MVQEVKLVIMGTGAVGKSAVTVKFVQGVFIHKYDPTIEDCYRKSLEVDGQQVIVDILDTAGTDQFGSMRDLYMKEGDGFIFVYDITSRGSFHELGAMHELMDRVRDGGAVPVMLMGNKADLADRRLVTAESGQQLAEQWGAAFCEVSAKTGEGLDAAFVHVVQEIVRERASIAAKRSITLGNKKRLNLRDAACVVL